MSAILTSGQPPGMRTKKGGGIGFMYDTPPPIFGAATANSSDGKKEYSRYDKTKEENILSLSYCRSFHFHHKFVTKAAVY